MSLTSIRVLLAQPTDALTLDLFRLPVGVPLFAYFLRTFFKTGDFNGADKLIDQSSDFLYHTYQYVSTTCAGIGYSAPLLLNSPKSPLFTIPGSLVYGHKE
jgi:hypothetical protein